MIGHLLFGYYAIGSSILVYGYFNGDFSFEENEPVEIEMVELK
tara:strand:- start:2128 stop:2256 length:129 start_codon:yes stop_codon:yes gene_type:complete